MANEAVDTRKMDQVYHYMMTGMVEHGAAPHYTELAKAFSVKPEEGKALLHGLVDTGIPSWLYPDTDYVASFAPYNNLPTQYRITVGGEKKWYGQ